jgi:hypothetical protein
MFLQYLADSLWVHKKDVPMNPEQRPLYGELVINSTGEEEEPVVDKEIHSMQDLVHQMIEEAAYYLAQKRGFKAGYELQDWLEAEKQILIQMEDDGK